MHRNTVWVLVCDAASARFFEVFAGERTWHLVSQISHDESRSKASDLVTDRAGRSSSEGGSVHHNALAPASMPKDVEKKRFAHTLGALLDDAMRSSRFRRWVLVAPPHFVGLVKKELTTELEKHLLRCVDKELTHCDLPELVSRLEAVIKIPIDQREERP